MLIASLALYGFAPFGFNRTKTTAFVSYAIQYRIANTLINVNNIGCYIYSIFYSLDQVQRADGTREEVSYYESDNLWVGPRQVSIA